MNRVSGILFFFAVAGTVLMGYYTQQSDFLNILLGYGAMFAFYIHALRNNDNKEIMLLVGAGVVLRLLLLPSYPPLSDDYFRFIWDGYGNLKEGFMPYQLKPEELIKGCEDPVLLELYPDLNSKIYYSVYPPLLQLVFTSGALLASKSILGSVIVMRLFLFAAEIGSLFFIKKLLEKWGKPAKWLLVYALNPLVIIEITGNLHFEGFMIFGLLGMLFFLEKSREKNSALLPAGAFYAFAIGAKLLPLMFAPLFFMKLGFKRTLIFGAVTLLGVILLFFPLFDAETALHFGESVSLYYRSFEFNGSIYFLARKVGYLVRGYNEIAYIGPGLAGVVLLSIIGISGLNRRQALENLPVVMLAALTIYQLCSTTVHPWYIAPLVALASLTRFRYPIVWSGLILLTYINYSYPEYHENLLVVGLEYTAVFVVLCLEVFRSKS